MFFQGICVVLSIYYLYFQETQGRFDDLHFGGVHRYTIGHQNINNKVWMSEFSKILNLFFQPLFVKEGEIAENSFHDDY